MTTDPGREAPRLRPAEEADAAAITALVAAAYGKWVPLIGRNPTPMNTDFRVAVRRHPIDLLETGGALCALIEMVPAADHLLIENVAVAPAWQGRGLGRRLLAHAEARAAGLGLGRVRLYTNARFVENLRLYRAIGYRTDRVENWTGGIVVHMSKPVAARV